MSPTVASRAESLASEAYRDGRLRLCTDPTERPRADGIPVGNPWGCLGAMGSVELPAFGRRLDGTHRKEPLQ